MAVLEALQVNDLRNLSHVRLCDLGRHNLFFGENGAGKTSLLEAIHLLGLSRSFRGPQIRSLVQRGRREFVISGLVRSAGPLSPLHRLGVSKSMDESSRIQVDGSSCRSAISLARLLPLQVLDSAAFELVLGAPAVRRQFLDWGVFHVEHAFFDLWQRVQRILKQRNSLLRRGKISNSELASWDVELSRVSEQLSAWRQLYVASLVPEVLQVLDLLGGAPASLALDYYRGWDSAADYCDVLSRGRDRDAELGYTRLGPHRADLRLKVDSLPAAQVLSRGQLKLLAIALRVAQARLYREHSGSNCVFLVDDLSAELDANRRQRVCGALQELGAQVFFTGVDADALMLSGLDSPETNVFHVEHGAVRRV